MTKEWIGQSKALRRKINLCRKKSQSQHNCNFSSSVLSAVPFGIGMLFGTNTDSQLYCVMSILIADYWGIILIIIINITGKYWKSNTTLSINNFEQLNQQLGFFDLMVNLQNNFNEEFSKEETKVRNARSNNKNK